MDTEMMAHHCGVVAGRQLRGGWQRGGGGAGVAQQAVEVTGQPGRGAHSVVPQHVDHIIQPVQTVLHLRLDTHTYTRANMHTHTSAHTHADRSHKHTHTHTRAPTHRQTHMKTGLDFIPSFICVFYVLSSVGVAADTPMRSRVLKEEPGRTIDMREDS